ncbi:MAG: ElyC/SanA/YdcF family protein [Bacteroidota bacterium]
MRKLLKLFSWSFLLVVAAILLINGWMYMTYRSSIYQEMTELDEGYPVALTLGTSRWTRAGSQNEFFSGRVDASAALYHDRVVSHLLLSGDNSQKEYNEPIELQRALSDVHVAYEDMTLDYAGFRTLDSVVRAKAIFGQDSIIIVSQSFHLPRALFIAHYHGIEAVGFAAQTPGNVPLRLLARELLARPVALFEVVLLGTQPKFLGKKEPILFRERSVQ